MIEYEEDFLVTLLFRCETYGVAIRAAMFAVPSACIAALLISLDELSPGTREEWGLFDLGHSTVWNATISVLVILLGFRTGQAFSRFWEGTGLLHQMRGEWFDTVSNCVTFSISARQVKPVEVMKFRHALVRLMSLCHGSALEEIAENSINVESIDIRGLDAGTLAHLVECHDVHGFNKVEVMLHLVQSLITSSHDAGLLKIPPPILSRVFQTISRGFVNLLNAKKISDTRFPFPYAQLITILLTIHTILTPIVITGTIRSKVMAAILSFIPVFCMFFVNFVASELENPFGTDDNDLPLNHFQDEMNSCLMMLLHTNTDMISGISPRCEFDFFRLLRTMKHDDRCSTRVQQRRLSGFNDFMEEEKQKEAELKAAGEEQAERDAAEHEQGRALLASAEAAAHQTAMQAKLAALHPRFSQNLDDFVKGLHVFSHNLEGEVMQMHGTFAALRSANSVSGWEAAAVPCC